VSNGIYWAEFTTKDGIRLKLPFESRKQALEWWENPEKRGNLHWFAEELRSLREALAASRALNRRIQQRLEQLSANVKRLPSLSIEEALRRRA
jgi:hypothetical protein